MATKDKDQDQDQKKGYFPSAFFSAFTTLPYFEGNDNFLTGIETVFKKYKKGLCQMQELSGVAPCKEDAEKDNFLYNPVPYCVFGEFDMAIISLIDDFSFATQNFKPDLNSPAFKYQVNTGIIPLIEAYFEKPEMPEFRDITIPEFFRNDILYPFTGIASVKLNNAMLVGIGKDFLKLVNFFLITWLDDHVRGKVNENKGYKFFYILNENLGWNEIAIYFFGNSMSYMQDLIMRVRQYTLREMKNYLLGLLKKPGYDYNTIRDDILPLFDLLKEKSLLRKFIRKDKKHSDCDPLESHAILATSVTYGFRPELISEIKGKKAFKEHCKFSDKQYAIFQRECDRLDFISINWKIKPGHEYEANKLIKSCFPHHGGKLTTGSQTGKYQFQFPKKPLSFRQYLDFAAIATKLREEEKSAHVLKVRSHLTWKNDLKLIKYKPKKHYRYNLEQYRIKKKEIDAIVSKLCVYPVPYTFKNQIENLIINFNDAVTDALMYNYFIGLKAPLLNFLEDRFDKGMYQKGKKVDAKSVEPLEDSRKTEYRDVVKKAEDDTLTFRTLDTASITDFIQNWNKAYWNRYFHSYYFTEINDFNIEHHGGIQQILFTYDTVYRLICKRIYGSDSKAPFINVQVVPNITSTQFYNTISFTHLFRPAIYACECVHEAANHIVTFLTKQGAEFAYKFLYDPITDRTGEEIDKRRERDNRMRIAVGPRDENEKNYLNQHFGMNAIRHIITDFCTYVLGYTDQQITHKPDLWDRKNFDKMKSSVELFYHTHWLLFLVRTDLYDREVSGVGYWFFNETDFSVLFIRLNLMIHLFLGYTREDLDKLNKECPSVELKEIWNSQKTPLLDMVIRLGNALEKEFELQTNASKNPDPDKHPSMEKFRETLVSIVLDNGWDQMKDKERKAYCKVIETNQRIIKYFYKFFSQRDQEYNIVKRKSAIDNTSVGGKQVTTNVRFYKGSSGRGVFLDPKGHLFSTSYKSREAIFLENISYIKDMWDISMKISISDY